MDVIVTLLGTVVIPVTIHIVRQYKSVQDRLWLMDKRQRRLIYYLHLTLLSLNDSDTTVNSRAVQRMVQEEFPELQDHRD